jgi:hypothetical protein
MSLITQALDRMRGKPDGALAARPICDLSAHKVLSQGKKIAAMLGIESPTSLIIYPGMPLNAGRLRFFPTSEFRPKESFAVQTAREEIDS